MVDFGKLRFDHAHHLGLGDVRITLAQQQEIEQVVTDLLEALESVVGQFGPDAHRYGCECNGRTPPADACSETLNKVRTAIARAKREG